MSFFLQLSTKEGVLTLTVATDFHCMAKILWKPMATINCLVSNILQSVIFYVQQKKETHTGLEQLESE